jgi:hypothetical protein
MVFPVRKNPILTNLLALPDLGKV